MDLKWVKKVDLTLYFTSLNFFLNNAGKKIISGTAAAFLWP